MTNTENDEQSQNPSQESAQEPTQSEQSSPIHETQSSTNAPQNDEKAEEYPQPNEKDRVEIVPLQPTQSYQYMPNQGPRPSQEEQQVYATAQRLSMFSLIGAAVSYFIGGVPLSLLAFIVGIIAYRKIKAGFENSSYVMKSEWSQSMRMVRVALVLSGGGIIINGIQTYLLFNALQDAGYMSVLTGGVTGSGATGGSTGGSSVWG